MLSDSDSEDVGQLTINEHFANAYAYRKEREELQKLKDKYGSDAEFSGQDESEDSEDLESEDEDGEQLTPAVDAAILRTLARIRKKDPEIYESSKNVFQEERQGLQSTQPKRRRAKEDKSAPLTLRRQALNSLLSPSGSRSPSPQPLTHVEEQSVLRRETISAFHGAVDGAGSDDEEEDDLLVPREKARDELDHEEEEYREFLEREVGQDLRELVTLDAPPAAATEGAAEEAEEDGEKKKKRKKDKKKKGEAPRASKEDDDQEFLINYIMNRGWIDRSAGRVPTYKEVTAGAGSSKSALLDDDDDDADGGFNAPNDEAQVDDTNGLDDEFEDVVDHFESSYNFRFEEPDAAEIKRFPRAVQATVRRADTTRKEARERRKERKEEEKALKREELARLRALKTKELRAKLDRIGREGGQSLVGDEALEALDLDADWDPTAHDQQMADLYGDAGDVDFDGGADEDADLDKPVWDDDIDISDLVPADSSKPAKKKKKKAKKGGADVDAAEGIDMDAMDADVTRALEEEEWDGTEEDRKRLVARYMDEMAGLEFNDLVGDLPTRFKYTPVDSDTFGLGPAEILRATDAELNTFVGLRQMAPYRERKRRWDTKRPEKLHELRSALAGRGVDIAEARTKRVREGAEGAADRPVKKRKGKKERLKEKVAVPGDAADDNGVKA